MQVQDPPWASSYGPGVPLRLQYGDDTLTDQFDATVARWSDRRALDFLGKSTTWSEVGDKVSRVAEGLRRLGVRVGDSVAIVMPNCPQNVIAFYAVIRLGATVVEHNPLYTTDELRKPFIDHAATVAIVWDKIVPVVEGVRTDSSLKHIVAVDMTTELPLLKRLALRIPIAKARAARDKLTAPAPDAIPWRDLVGSPPLEATHPRPNADDIALLLYTSGTTGTPKGVPLRHRNLIANVEQGRAWVPGLEEGNETFLLALPLFHAYGMTVGMLLGTHLGATLVLLPKPDTDLLMEAIKRQIPTFVPAVPPLYQRIVTEAERSGVSIHGIRYSLSGAMQLPSELVERWETATGGLLVEGYGLTETSPVVVGNPMTKDRRPGSIGVPFPDVEVRIADPSDLDHEVPIGERGELLLRGPQVFDGYRGMPKQTAESFHDGWFRTGDIVMMDKSGFITIVDRIKEIIITGGFNVYPSDVESVLRAHDAVADVSVVGLRRADGSEELVAAVVLAKGLDDVPDGLHSYARESLTAYKIPRRFIVVEVLPVNALGKVLRREVTTMLE